MKKFKFSTVIVLLSLLSMGMGFPDIVSEREDESDTTDRVKKAQQLVQTQALACSRKVYKATQAKQSAKLEKQEQPAAIDCELVCEKAASSINNVALKLFDNKGNILLIENVQLSDFFSSDYPSNTLPAGSTFVMFYGNTAYYFLDQEKLAYIN